ncbi:MAG TPA: hypothetical protein VKE71_15210 [Candidatus Angelobacter sp.]|nr:hypothetical protein [Candidatus Angelobacter sp.]
MDAFRRADVTAGKQGNHHRPEQLADHQCFPKLETELLVPIVQHVTTAIQVSAVLHRGVARHLRHPTRARMACDAAQ